MNTDPRNQNSFRAPSHPEQGTDTNPTTSDIYHEITAQVLDLLDDGIIPWRSPLLADCSGAGYPRNLVTGRLYRGINVFLLSMAAHRNGFATSAWLTLRQANERGGRVRKGERSTTVVLWKQFETTDKRTEEPVTVPVLRRYAVFNVAQCEGLGIDACQPLRPLDVRPIDAAERIVQGYADGPSIVSTSCIPQYRPGSDTVMMPPVAGFVSREDYYSTLFHEISHSTGHPARLGRFGGAAGPGAYGSYDYGREELVAEMASAFLCGLAGIRPAVVENQAAYVRGWMSAIRADRRLLVSAAAAAQRAADWICNGRTATADHSRLALNLSPC